MSGIDGSGAGCGGVVPALRHHRIINISPVFHFKVKIRTGCGDEINSGTSLGTSKDDSAPEFLPHRTNMIFNASLEWVMIRILKGEIGDCIPYS